MSKLIIKTPTKLVLPSEWIGSSIETELNKELRFKDLKVDFAIKKWKEHLRNPNSWFVREYGVDAVHAKIAEMETGLVRSALFKKDGELYTYSGLAHRIATSYGCQVERAFPMPEPQLIAWQKQPPPSRWYQQKSEDLLLSIGHGAVELATGLGKSNIICNLLYRLGLPSVVVAPTLSIANQLYKDCINYFGPANVGRFFSGKKEAKKKFTIAVSKSLTLLKPGSDDYNTLRKKLVVIGDESHLLPAATLAKVVLQMFSDAPYRFFLSGTQTRSDGMGIVLEGIIGHIVMHMDVKEGVDQGFLSKPKFVQVRLNSTAPQQKNFDPIKANRTHLHKNPLVYDHVGKLVKWAVKSGKKPLVLLEEVSQFGYLWPHIKDIPNIGFAHGGVDTKLKRFIPEKFHKSDSMTLVSSFDCGILDILVGTQCIGVGTDIKTADVIIDVVGLASEVRLRQNVGRGTRKHNGKTDFMYVDYNIQNIPVLSKQAEKRLAIFNSIYGPVKVL